MPTTRQMIAIAFAAAVISTIAVSLALAQSSPNLVPGQVPTATQWNSYFISKQDTLGYSPVRKSGDVMLGLLRFSMTAPTLSSCGTGPSIRGNNQAGEVTTGTGSPTGCTITFSTTAPYISIPSCLVTWGANLVAMSYSVSQTTLTLTQTGTSQNKISYFCTGLQ